MLVDLSDRVYTGSWSVERPAAVALVDGFPILVVAVPLSPPPELAQAYGFLVEVEARVKPVTGVEEAGACLNGLRLVSGIARFSPSTAYPVAELSSETFHRLVADCQLVAVSTAGTEVRVVLIDRADRVAGPGYAAVWLRVSDVAVCGSDGCKPFSARFREAVARAWEEARKGASVEADFEAASVHRLAAARYLAGAKVEARQRLVSPSNPLAYAIVAGLGFTGYAASLASVVAVSLRKVGAAGPSGLRRRERIGGRASKPLTLAAALACLGALEPPWVYVPAVLAAASAALVALEAGRNPSTRLEALSSVLALFSAAASASAPLTGFAAFVTVLPVLVRASLVSITVSLLLLTLSLVLLAVAERLALKPLLAASASAAWLAGFPCIGVPLGVAAAVLPRK